MTYQVILLMTSCTRFTVLVEYIQNNCASGGAEQSWRADTCNWNMLLQGKHAPLADKNFRCSCIGKQYMVLMLAAFHSVMPIIVAALQHETNAGWRWQQDIAGC